MSSTILYVCDPEKNQDCRKTGCKIRGGPCSLTWKIEAAETDRTGFPVIYGVRIEREEVNRDGPERNHPEN